MATKSKSKGSNIMKLLGIETSCDETAAAIIEASPSSEHVTLVSNVITSSLLQHAATGGIIPENAARQQITYILPVIQEALQKANLSYKDIDAIAVTYGPGLIGSLLVGVETAKTLSYVWSKPIIPVNHLYGHLYANWINVSKADTSIKRDKSTKRIKGGFTAFDASDTFDTFATPLFPSLGLIVSGGHTDLVLIKSHGNIAWLGGTRDDAAGECFDKCARLLGYSYPGGPKIAELAKKGNPKAFQFPRPMIGSHDFEFSFSGLKTAFLNETKQSFPILRTSTEKIGWEQIALEKQMTESQKQTLYNLCASLQQAIVDVLVKKTMQAAQKYNVKSIILGGGVAANESLRNRFALEIRNLRPKVPVGLDIPFFFPEKWLCTDNGAMIAAAGFFNNKEVSWKDLTANPELYFD